MFFKKFHRIVPILSIFILPINLTAKGPWKKIDSFLESDQLNQINTGIAIIDLSNGKLIYNHNNKKLFVPASNVKLLTAYTALKKLNPRFTFTTSFSTDSIIDSLRIHNLVIKSNGDHFMTMAEINLIVLTISKRIKAIEGDVIVDNSSFDSTSLGKGWMWDDKNSLIAPFSFNNNRINFTISPGIHEGDPLIIIPEPLTGFVNTVVHALTGKEDNLSIKQVVNEQGDEFIFSGTSPLSLGKRTLSYPVSRPGLFASTLIKELLQNYGISVSGTARSFDIKDTMKTLATFESPSLSTVLSHMLKESNNLSSECILKSIGLVEKGAPGDADAGICAIKRELSALGIKEKDYRIVDGSGLSTYNLISPQIIVSVLKAAYDDFTIYPEFVSSLSIGGIDGTLANRFKGTMIENQIRGKTGTLSGVCSLSGYLKTRHGRFLAFSIIFNGFVGSSAPVREAQDEIVRMIFEEM
ncbi:MAG: D-alanyl-D-alanine carboxypeptidase/D-alanyl-D-alanine-endopeptidase [Fibrobacter sp.]|nr:D-alanyl-D-alanine carboxypeptidase/D-alanyl-D-alanine-endopeptidase [Fibrobacter sp.]